MVTSRVPSKFLLSTDKEFFLFDLRWIIAAPLLTFLPFFLFLFSTETKKAIMKEFVLLSQTTSTIFWTGANTRRHHSEANWEWRGETASRFLSLSLSLFLSLSLSLSPHSSFLSLAALSPSFSFFIVTQKQHRSRCLLCWRHWAFFFFFRLFQLT